MRRVTVRTSQVKVKAKRLCPEALSGISRLLKGKRVVSTATRMVQMVMPPRFSSSLSTPQERLNQPRVPQHQSPVRCTGSSAVDYPYSSVTPLRLFSLLLHNEVLGVWIAPLNSTLFKSWQDLNVKIELRCGSSFSCQGLRSLRTALASIAVLAGSVGSTGFDCSDLKRRRESEASPNCELVVFTG
jgi:hypothetical protein